MHPTRLGTLGTPEAAADDPSDFCTVYECSILRFKIPTPYILGAVAQQKGIHTVLLESCVMCMGKYTSCLLTVHGSSISVKLSFGECATMLQPTKLADTNTQT